MYNPSGISFIIIENIVLENLESFFQLSHEIDISLYLTKVATLRHSKEVH